MLLQCDMDQSERARPGKTRQVKTRFRQHGSRMWIAVLTHFEYVMEPNHARSCSVASVYKLYLEANHS